MPCQHRRTLLQRSVALAAWAGLPELTLFDGRNGTQADADGQVLVLHGWAS